MQRFGMILERFISPEASFPVFGRSMLSFGSFSAIVDALLERNVA